MTESINCANRSDHQAPGQQVHYLNTIEIPLVKISDLFLIPAGLSAACSQPVKKSSCCENFRHNTL